MMVGITGARGYVGSHLARSLTSRGHEIVPITRDHGFCLGQPVCPGIVAGLDALIHTAYDFSVRGRAEIERVNVRGSVSLFNAGVTAGVPRLVFLSSMAAYDGCRSLYGRGKLAVEADVLRLGGYVVRPGTIHGGDGGGLFRSLTSLVAKLPLIPLPGRGDQVLRLIHIDDLAALLERMLNTDLPEGQRLVSAACPEGMIFRDILTQIARSQGRRRLFFSVPSALLLTSLQVAEVALGAMLPVRSDSIVSLLNSNPTPNFTLPAALEGTRFRAFESDKLCRAHP